MTHHKKCSNFYAYQTTLGAISGYNRNRRILRLPAKRGAFDVYQLIEAHLMLTSMERGIWCLPVVTKSLNRICAKWAFFSTWSVQIEISLPPKIKKSRFRFTSLNYLRWICELLCFVSRSRGEMGTCRRLPTQELPKKGAARTHCAKKNLRNNNNVGILHKRKIDNFRDTCASPCRFIFGLLRVLWYMLRRGMFKKFCRSPPYPRKTKD